MKNKFIFLILVLMLLVPSTFALIPESNMKIFAVSGDSAKEATLNVKVVEGSGKIFSSIDESIVGSSTQESFKNAVSVANKVIGEDIRHKYDFTIDIESNAYSIDGPSAGGSMSLLLISMFEDKSLSNKVSMTGSITADGYIGDVGGIYQKTKRAAEIGIELFFIPQGNRTQLINEDGQIEQIDLISYAYENWNLKIVEVLTINDVLDYAFLDISEIDVSVEAQEKIDDFIYGSIVFSKAVDPFKQITFDYINQTEEQLLDVKENLSSTSIKDTDVLQNLLSTINYSQELLEISRKYYENNYFYSAANNSFLAYVNVITVNEIITNPSILADSSIVFDLRIDSLEDKIKITENRSNNCSLEYLEWCVGGRQRMTWAKDKLEKINNVSSGNNFSKIQDYAYAVAWTDIANSFLDISITNKEVKFVEGNHFKNRAQENIISVENQLILVAPELSESEDLKRRLDAAKRNFNRGWYVTSLYDSATALAVIKTHEENKNKLSTNDFLSKYENLTTRLRSQSALNNENYVWSKTFLDHALYYYTAYENLKDKDVDKANSQRNIANSIFNFSTYLYQVEIEVLDYYLNTDIETLIIDISESTDSSVIIVDVDKKEVNKETPQNVYVYSKQKDKSSFYIYLFAIALFLMIVAIVFEIERFKKHHSREGVIKQIGYLDEKLIEGRISPYTYKEMRNKYLLELEKIKQKESLKSKKKVKDIDSVLDTATELEKTIIDKQIEELEKRRKELSLQGKSDSIKNVSKIVSKIKPKSKKTVAVKKTSKKTKKNLSLKKGL